MITLKANINKDVEVVDIKSFDFREVAKEIHCQYFEPVEVYVDDHSYVVLCDEEGAYKENATYTGFFGGLYSYIGKIQVYPIANEYLIAKYEKHEDYRELVGLDKEDLDILAKRVIKVSNPNKESSESHIFMNLTDLSNEEFVDYIKKNF